MAAPTSRATASPIRTAARPPMTSRSSLRLPSSLAGRTHSTRAPFRSRVSWESTPSPKPSTAAGYFTAQTRATSARSATWPGSTSTTTASFESSMPVKTPLLLLWAFLTLVWSIFTPPHRTFAARMILFQPLWAVRMWTDDASWTSDLALFEVLHTVYSFAMGHWSLPGRQDFPWLDLDSHNLQIYAQLFSLLGMCALLAGGINFRGRTLGSPDPSPTAPIAEQRIDEQVLPPLLLPSKTSHTRLFPKKHSFAYSYLLVGVPVGSHGRISKVLSIDSNRKSWFAVDAPDYLERGDRHTMLSGKLRHFLQTKGIGESDYAFAYLVTAPRFLGYSFNPVSFWYLYDSETFLKYMILEVNNTFDERRMYLLRRASKGEESDLSLAEPSNGRDRQAIFTQSWEKDFHVSPFNSRKGSYSLKATDPLVAFETTGKVTIDNTITLRSSKEHPKLVARVWTTSEPLSPKSISSFQLLHFIASWWWVGFVTFPRIVYEAGRLFFQRRLHVWFRPEVTTTSIGRTYTNDEKTLESFFRALLTQAVHESNQPLRVVYEPAHANGPEIVLYSPACTYEEDLEQTVTLKVLSPAFYSRLVHYAHIKEALDREGLATDEKNQTILIQNATAVPALLEALHDQTSHLSDLSRKLNPLERLRWSLMTRLRCPPALASYPNSNVDPRYRIADIRSAQPSELDHFVATQCDDRETYRHIVTKLFLAERIGLGVPALVDIMDGMVRACLLLGCMIYSDRSRSFVDVLRPRSLDRIDWANFAFVAWPLANSVHLWSLIKGFT